MILFGQYCSNNGIFAGGWFVRAQRRRATRHFWGKWRWRPKTQSTVRQCAGKQRGQRWESLQLRPNGQRGDDWRELELSGDEDEDEDEIVPEEELKLFLAGNALSTYYPLFQKEQVSDMQTLLLLTEADLEKMGLGLGPRKRLIQAILQFRADMDDGRSSGQAAAEVHDSRLWIKH